MSRKRPNYLHSGKRSEDSENVHIWAQCLMPKYKQQSKDCLVMEGNYWGDVRQEHTNKVERQSVQDGYKTGHMVQNKLERRRRGNCTQLKCACAVRGKTRLDHVRNVDIWNEAHMYPRIPQREEVEMVRSCTKER